MAKKKVYWVDGRPVVLGRISQFLFSTLTLLVALVGICVAAVAPLAMSMGIGYALSSFTEIPLATSIALGLGSVLVAVVFTVGRGLAAELKELLGRMTDLYDDEEDDDE